MFQEAPIFHSQNDISNVSFYSWKKSGIASEWEIQHVFGAFRNNQPHFWVHEKLENQYILQQKINVFFSFGAEQLLKWIALSSRSQNLSWNDCFLCSISLWDSRKKAKTCGTWAIFELPKVLFFLFIQVIGIMIKQWTQNAILIKHFVLNKWF